MDDQTDDQKNQADQKKRRDRRQHFERDQVGEFHLDVKRFHERRQSLGGKQRNKETRQGDQHGECSSEKPQSTPHQEQQNGNDPDKHMNFLWLSELATFSKHHQRVKM